MDLDRILHEKKNFAELIDEDVKTFLSERRFRSEHLNLEFKREFPIRGNGKYDIREVCRYIVGFSNEEGGLVVYGVEDSIRKAEVQFPDYVPGLAKYPSLEDLSLWVTERIHPLVQSPAIRLFNVQGGAVLILKVPAGVNKPYCYHDPGDKAMIFFKKTAAGIHELAPDEVRELYRTAILDQSARILRAEERRTGQPSVEETKDPRLEEHLKSTLPKLENIRDYGYLGIFCYPFMLVNIPVPELEDFVNVHRGHFSEAMRFFPRVEVFQTGVSAGYFPRAIRQDIKSTARVTLYTDGVAAFDSQVDSTMDRNKTINPYWLSYEIQRHLQLSKALLQPRGVDVIHFRLDLEGIEDFSMRFGEGFGGVTSPYAGRHSSIERDLKLVEVHDYNGDKRNIVIPAVQEVMDEVARVFGLSNAPAGLWDTAGHLTYVKGLENQR